MKPADDSKKGRSVVLCASSAPRLHIRHAEDTRNARARRFYERSNVLIFGVCDVRIVRRREHESVPGSGSGHKSLRTTEQASPPPRPEKATRRLPA